MRQVEHYLLYEKRQNGILHENYYGRDQKGNRDVYVKIFETKKVPDLQPIRRHINNEIMIQQQVYATNQSKQTLQLVDNYLTQNSIYLIYLNHSFRTLKSFIQYKNMLTERQATDYFAQIYSAYSEIAKINAIARDMTMENLLIDDDENIKIDDFGIFKFFYLQKNSSVKSRINEGPETYTDRSNYTKEKSDSWSIGVVLFQLLFQKDPQFKSGELVVPIDRSVSPAMVDLLKQLLAEQPSRRLSWSNIFSHACMINFYNLETQQEDWGMSLSAFIRPSNQNITERYPKLQNAAAKASANSSDSKPTNYTQLARALSMNSNSNNSSEKKEYPKLGVTQQQTQQQQQYQQQSQLKYPSLPIVVEHMMPPGSAIYQGTCLESNYEKYLFVASNTILSQSTFSDKSNKANSLGQAGSLSNNSNQFMNNQSMKQTPFNPFANVNVQSQQQQHNNQMQQQQQLQQQQLQQQKLREQQELQQQQLLQQQQQQRKKEEEEELLKQQKLLFQQQVAQENMRREAADKAKKEQEMLMAKQQQLENEQKIQQLQQQQYQQQQQAKLLAQQQQQQQLQQQQQQQQMLQQQQQQMLQQQQQQQQMLLQQQQQQLLMQQQQQQLVMQQQYNVSQGITNLNQNQQLNLLEQKDDYEDDYEIIQQESNASSINSFQLQSQFMIQKRKKQDRFNKIIGKNKQKSSSSKQNERQQQQEQLDQQVDDEIVKIEQQLLQENNKQSQQQQQQQNGQQQQFQQQQSYPAMNNLSNQMKKVDTNNSKNMLSQPNGFNPFSGNAMGVSVVRGGQPKEQQQPDESARAVSNKKIFDKNVKYLQSELDKFNVLAQAVETAEELLDAKNNFWVVVSYMMLKRLWLVRSQLADSLENHERIDEEFEEWELFCISSEFQRVLDKLHNSNKSIQLSALGLQKLTQKRIQRLNPQVSKELVQHLPLEETSNFAANFFVHIHFHILSLLESVPNQPPPAKIALLKHIAQLKDILLIVEQGIFNNSDVFFNLQKHNAIQATSSEEAINEYIANKNKSLQIFTAYYKSLGYEI